MIETEEDLITVVAQASGLIQEISDYLGENRQLTAMGKIRFPRGFIETAAAKRRKIPFVTDRRLKANISYAMMTHDVLRWIITRTDLSGQAKEMIIKEGVCLIGSICESMTIFPRQEGLGRRHSFARRVNRLLELGIVDQALSVDLTWLWEKRNQEHIFDNPFYEYSHYREADWGRSLQAYHKLRDALNAWRGH